MKDTKVRRDVSLGQGTLILAQDDLQCPATHREVYDMPGVWKVSATHRHNPGTAPHFHGTHWQQICFMQKEWTF